MHTAVNERIQQIIDDLVQSGEEVGLQVAAYHDGDLIVDAWAGVADPATGQQVDGDTLFTAWSTTKGFAITCLHLLAERGQVAYDTPVARYWPEFAANGKGPITVHHVLTHQAGIPQLPTNVTPELMTDWDGMCAAIATHAPLWMPGTKTGYHAWTFGWIIGELIRRVDGRPIAQFAREELCQPLGITDFYLGIPDAVEARVAPLRQAPPLIGPAIPTGGLALQVVPPQVTSAEALNRPDVRRASIPGGGGIMNARALARHYAMLAGEGELEGVRLLSAARVAQIRSLQTDAYDEVLGKRVRKGLGYFLGGPLDQGGDERMGSTGTEFGHPGAGGFLGFADPARRLSFGLTKNLMTVGSTPERNAATMIAAAIRQSLDAAPESRGRDR
jgi:CubicO group peptidase (beta-lactamase class C family)